MIKSIELHFYEIKHSLSRMPTFSFYREKSGMCPYLECSRDFVLLEIKPGISIFKASIHKFVLFLWSLKNFLNGFIYILFASSMC